MRSQLKLLTNCWKLNTGEHEKVESLEQKPGAGTDVAMVTSLPAGAAHKPKQNSGAFYLESHVSILLAKEKLLFLLSPITKNRNPEPIRLFDTANSADSVAGSCQLETPVEHGLHLEAPFGNQGLWLPWHNYQLPSFWKAAISLILNTLTKNCTLDPWRTWKTPASYSHFWGTNSNSMTNKQGSASNIFCYHREMVYSRMKPPSSQRKLSSALPPKAKLLAQWGPQFTKGPLKQVLQRPGSKDFRCTGRVVSEATTQVWCCEQHR